MVAWTGSHQGPIPTSTSSPAPTIPAFGGPIRIVGVTARVAILVPQTGCYISAVKSSVTEHYRPFMR